MKSEPIPRPKTNRATGRVMMRVSEIPKCLPTAKAPEERILAAMGVIEPCSETMLTIAHFCHLGQL